MVEYNGEKYKELVMGAGNRSISGSQGVVLPLWEFLGGGAYEPDGGNLPITLPTGTEIIHMVTQGQGGEVRYAFSPIAQEDSHGYVPENGRLVIGPIRDLTKLGFALWGDGVTVHIEFYRENRG